MANIAWKQAVLNSANAVRSVLGHNDKILVKDLCNIIRGLKPNTSDATVEPNEVMNGEIAYGPEGKVIGTAPFKFIEDISNININNINLETTNLLTHIVYGNGKYIAFTDDTKYAYSTDGVNWIFTEIPFPDGYLDYTYIQDGFIIGDIIYGDNKFILVLKEINTDEEFVEIEQADIIMYSEDGFNWSYKNIDYSRWSDVSYNNGKFIAVSGGNNNSIYSNDGGITWSSGTLPTEGFWCCCVGNEKMVAICTGYNNNSTAAYSTDGINWIETTLPVLNHGLHIAYGNGKFIAVGASDGSDYSHYDTNIALYSEDGVNWNSVTLPISADWSAITYGDGKFVAVASNSNFIIYSEDGINWEKIETNARFFDITYDGNKFILMGIGNIITYIEFINYVNYEVLEQSVLSANGCEDRTLYISNNEIVLDSMFTKINVNV